MSIGAQALTVDERERQRIDHFVSRQAEHFPNDRCRRHLHQHDVIESDLVERVFQCETALDFVRLDHGGEYMAHRERGQPLRHGRARQPVGGHQNAAQVIGRMSPLGRQPGVVEVEPANHRPEAERRLYRIELIGRAGHLRAVGHDRPRHDGPEQFGAGGIGERLEAAAERVDQTIASGLEGQIAADLVGEDVVDNIRENLVGCGPHVRDA